MKKMEVSKNFTDKFMVIVPVHEYSDEVNDLLVKATNSVDEKIKVLLSLNKDIYDLVVAHSWKTNIEFLCGEEGKSSFAELVNHAVKNLPTDVQYFSILEFDDTYNDNWFVNVENYINYYPEISVFMPIEEIFNYTDSKFVGYGNEAPWASSFSTEIGFLDKESLEDYADYYLTGSVFNKNDWNLIGGLKESIKLSFWYEFLLRCMNKKKDVFVIPKTGYKHYINRKKSLYDLYSNEMDEKESLWWFNLAKKECKYTEDRKKVYPKPEN